jgi:hypothetical protein
MTVVVHYEKESILEIAVCYMNGGGILAAMSLAISPVVQTLSNVHSISRNKVTVALLLLKSCVMRSTET